jgi:hypothetical protein
MPAVMLRTESKLQYAESFAPNSFWLSRTCGKRWGHKGDFMRRSTCNVNGERKTKAVCHGHDLRTLAPLGLSHTTPAVFATTKVPLMKHADRWWRG